MQPRSSADPMHSDSTSESEHDKSASASDEDVAIHTSARAYEKDSDEEELERFVLGDTATFRSNLFRDDPELDPEHSDFEGFGSGDENEDNGPGLEDVDDADLFAFDVGGSIRGDGEEKQKSAILGPTTTQRRPIPRKDAPAWEDSDDERLTVSLANTTHLRKLRISEADDVVSGTEYIQRLRQQFLALNPLPAWAQEVDKTRPSKRRRTSSAASDDSDVYSDDEEADGGDDFEASVLPLDKFLRDASALQGRRTTKRKMLRPEVIEIQRSRDIPDVHKDEVTSVAFHPEYPVLLSSSTSSVLYIHHIAPTAHPTPNPMLTSAKVQHVPVRRAEFLQPRGDKIFFAGRRRYIHSWDLTTGTIQKTSRIQGHNEEQRTWERFKLSPCGRYLGLVSTLRKGGGTINILNAASMQWIAAARLDSRGGVADFCWWRNGNGLTILGKGGTVGEWSMASRRFVGVWNDEGSNGGTVVALGGGRQAPGPSFLGEDQWVAVGSNSGVVNIYQRRDLIDPSSENEDVVQLKQRPGPTRTFMQLTTTITILTFSPDGQLLAFGSRFKRDALRLVHLPSCTVYRNWPTQQTPLGRITDLAFGSRSDMLAVGNDNGNIRLWEIRN